MTTMLRGRKKRWYVMAARPMPGNLPLDIITAASAGAGYGLRKIKSSYGGPCCNIRRSSDNATQDIGFAGTDFDVAGFSAFVGGGNGFVTSWYDQSGNGRHAVQGTAANQPQLTLGATTTGRPALVSSSVTIGLTATTPALAYPMSLNSVTKRTGAFTVFDVVISFGNSYPGIFYQNSADGGIGLANINSAILNSVGATDALFRVAIGVRPAGGTGSVTVDSTTVTGVLGDVVGSTALSLFDPNISGGLIGSMCEAIWFQGALGAGDILNLQTNQKAYYGTP
jgi:hypothetical protein